MMEGDEATKPGNDEYQNDKAATKDSLNNLKKELSREKKEKKQEVSLREKKEKEERKEAKEQERLRKRIEVPKKNRDIFPDSRKNERTNAKFAPMTDPYEITRGVTIIQAEFLKYPSRVLSLNLKKCFLLFNLSFFGKTGFAGTNSSDCVYMNNQGPMAGYTNEYLRKLFHKEFSSILFKNYGGQSLEEKWNINNFLYKDKSGGVNSLNRSPNLDPLLYSKGFLTQYAQSTFVNDFNSFAGELFTNKDFRSIYDNPEYSIIKHKADLVIDFYNKIDPRFTLEYFKQLGN